MIFILPVTSGGYSAYQTFLLENLRKYYPDPTVFAKSTQDIIERFWKLDLSYTDELFLRKYSVFPPKPRTLSSMQRSYLLSINFKVHSLTDLNTIKNKSSLCNPQRLSLWEYARCQKRDTLSLPRQENGNWNTMPELQRNAQINVRK